VNIKFIKKFLDWYQDKFHLSEVNTRIKLEELAQEAEKIWNQYQKEQEINIRVQKYNKQYLEEVESHLQEGMMKKIVKQVKKKIKRKRISRYL